MKFRPFLFMDFRASLNLVIEPLKNVRIPGWILSFNAHDWFQDAVNHKNKINK